MVALNFPDSPTDGQEYGGYVYDATIGAWNRLPTLPALDLVEFSAVAPSNPQDGQFWFDTNAGKMYIYYNDGSSAQWVSTLGGLVGQTGEEGQMLIHNGTEWVAYDGKSRNLIYNGAMQVAQRGTTATGLTNGSSGYHTADRWRFQENGAPTYEATQTVEADGPSGSGFTKSLKMDITTAQGSLAAADRMVIQQRLEGQDLQGIKKGTAEAESLTLSFWVKSNVTDTFVVTFEDPSNSRYICATYSVSSADTWEKKTITIPGDTVGAIDNDNSARLVLWFWLACGSDLNTGTLPTSWQTGATSIASGQTNLAASSGNYWQVTGVQLETGTVATGFDHKPYGVELALCQRYYYIATPEEAGGGARKYSGSAINVAFNATGTFPTEMRTTPSLTEIDAGQLENCTSPSYSMISNKHWSMRVTTTGANWYRALDQILGLDAEL